MAILGYNVKDTADASGFSAGRIYVTKFTLAAASTLQELHGWFTQAAGGTTLRIVIYADTAGSPGARVAYTNVLTMPGGGDTEMSQTGFSVPLAAGDYWIGFECLATTGSTDCYAGTGGIHKGITGGAPDPPPDPFGTTNTSGTRKHCVWAVVAAAAPPPVADFTGTPLTGPRPLSVTFTDTSTNSPTSWAWTFGDGGTSSAQNPTHSYTVAGTYTVTLVATNSAGSNTKTRTAYVTVANPSGTFTKIKFGDGLDVTDEGAGVIEVNAADATTSAKGVVQLAGDLAGTATSPQIATGVIVDADVAAANKDGTAATPSMRTLGTGAQQAAAGNDNRFLPAVVNGQWLKGSGGAAVWSAITMADVSGFASCSAGRSSASVVASGGFGPATHYVAFDFVNHDRPGGMWSAANPTRITIPAAGVYSVFAIVYFDANAAGARECAIVANHSTTVAYNQYVPAVASGNAPYVFATSTAYLNAGDYIELAVGQTSGGNLNVYTNAVSLGLRVWRIAN